MARVMRTLTFETAMDKARWIDGMCSLDARFPKVQKVARTFGRAYGPNDPEGIARGLHRFVRDGIIYVPDPEGEQLSDSQQILEEACGDCDDKARLYVALCRSVKVRAHILPIFEGNNFRHVQALVYLPGKPPLRSELIVKGVELGERPLPGAPLAGDRLRRPYEKRARFVG